MEPINIYAHLYPQIAAVMTFAIALLPVAGLVLADRVAVAGQLATAGREVDRARIERRLVNVTAIPLIASKGQLPQPSEHAAAIRASMATILAAEAAMGMPSVVLPLDFPRPEQIASARAA